MNIKGCRSVFREHRSHAGAETNIGGFTLVELVVTMAVVLIVLSIGIPSYSALSASNRATSEANALVAAVNLARSEAIKQGVPVVVCAAKDPLPALNGCGDASDWTNGWLVFTDEDSDGVLDTGVDQMLRAFAALSAQTTFGAGGTSLVRYTPSGKKQGGAVSFDMYQNGCKGNHKRTISISTTGTVNTTKGACP